MCGKARNISMPRWIRWSTYPPKYHTDHADRQRYTAAVKHPTEHVTALSVGAEKENAAVRSVLLEAEKVNGALDAQERVFVAFHKEMDGVPDGLFLSVDATTGILVDAKLETIDERTQAKTVGPAEMDRLRLDIIHPDKSPVGVIW
jgi:hypothetical protein